MKRKKKSSHKKLKGWSWKVADKKFSEWIRARDGKCQKCGGSNQLSCSHFWKRSCYALRYEPDNCIALCLWGCHVYGWEKEKQGAYRDFMINKLGQERYDELYTIYKQVHMKRSEAVERCQKFLESMALVEAEKKV